MAAFGSCRLIDENGLPTQIDRQVLEEPVSGSVYQTLLYGTCLNPFGRHIFRRQLFTEIGYLDESLRAADDYDFYLRAAALFPYGSHPEPVVEYREHSATLSQKMHTSKHWQEVHRVYAKQKPYLRGNPENALAHQAGINHWRSLYGPYLVYDVARYLKQRDLSAASRVLYLTLRYQPRSLLTWVSQRVIKINRLT
jgi:hypothetical protein